MDVDKLYSELPSKPWLFHYTPKAGFLGIFRTRSVWAGNIHYMDDAKEFAHAMDLVNARTEDMVGFDHSERTGFRKLVNSLFQGISRINVYVFSLSEQSDLLSQWRGYADSSGFVIEFDWKRLSKVASTQGFRLGRCLYDKEKKQAVIDNMVKAAQDAYFQGLSEGSRKNEIQRALYDSFIIDFVSVSPLLKHHAFREEKEWRLVSRPIRMDAPQVDYREGRSMLIPYFKLNLNEGSNTMPVTGIIVGPCPHPELSANSAVNFVQRTAKFTNISIRHSRIPYREW